MILVRKVIYSIFYKEKASVCNEDVLRVFHDNIHLRDVYRKENKYS